MLYAAYLVMFCPSMELANISRAFLNAMPSLAAKTTAYVLAVSPLALLIIVVLLTFNYGRLQRRSKQCHPETLSRLTTMHAFATEGVQIVLAGHGVFSMYYFTAATQHIVIKNCRLTMLAMWPTTAAVATSVVVLHVIAVYAVDLIEGRILMGGWIHPYGWRPFVIMRSWIFGQAVKRISSVQQVPGKPSTRVNRDKRFEGLDGFIRTRSMSLPGTKAERAVLDSWDIEYTKHLEYLDLANQVGHLVRLDERLLRAPVGLRSHCHRQLLQESLEKASHGYRGLLHVRERYRHHRSDHRLVISTSTSSTGLSCIRRSASSSPAGDLATSHDSCSASQSSISAQLLPSPPKSLDSADGEETIKLVGCGQL